MGGYELNGVSPYIGTNGTLTNGSTDNGISTDYYGEGRISITISDFTIGERLLAQGWCDLTVDNCKADSMMFIGASSLVSFSNCDVGDLTLPSGGATFTTDIIVRGSFDIGNGVTVKNGATLTICKNAYNDLKGPAINVEDGSTLVLDNSLNSITIWNIGLGIYGTLKSTSEAYDINIGDDVSENKDATVDIYGDVFIKCRELKLCVSSSFISWTSGKTLEITGSIIDQNTMPVGSPYFQMSEGTTLKLIGSQYHDTYLVGYIGIEGNLDTTELDTLYIGDGKIATTFESSNQGLSFVLSCDVVIAHDATIAYWYGVEFTIAEGKSIIVEPGASATLYDVTVKDTAGNKIFFDNKETDTECVCTASSIICDTDFTSYVINVEAGHANQIITLTPVTDIYVSGNIRSGTLFVDSNSTDVKIKVPEFSELEITSGTKFTTVDKVDGKIPCIESGSAEYSRIILDKNSICEFGNETVAIANDCRLCEYGPSYYVQVTGIPVEYGSGTGTSWVWQYDTYSEVLTELAKALIPDEGYVLVQWLSADGNEVTADTQVILGTSHVLTAVFEEEPNTVITTVKDGDTVTDNTVTVAGNTDGDRVVITVNGVDAGSVEIGTSGDFSKKVTLHEGKNTIVVTTYKDLATNVQTFGVSYPSSLNIVWAILPIVLLCIGAIAVCVISREH